MIESAVFAGEDPNGLVDALRAEDVSVTVLEGIANRDALEEAGISGVDALILTDVGQATAIPVAKELNPDVRVIVYAGASLPEFVSAQQVLAVDPDLLSVEAVAEEIADLER
jgi:hypothetical protein